LTKFWKHEDPTTGTLMVRRSQVQLSARGSAQFYRSSGAARIIDQ
jgi:hypothetical protein